MNKITLFIFLLLSWKVSSSQFFTTSVQVNSLSGPWKLLVMNDGSYMILGRDYWAGISDSTVMVNLDISGNVKWVKNYSGSNHATERIGENNIAMYSDMSQLGSSNYRFIVFDGNGNLLSCAPIADTMGVLSMHTTADKGTIASGRICRNCDFNFPNRVAHCIIKTDSSGNYEWVKVIDSSFVNSEFEIVEIIQTIDSGYMALLNYSYMLGHYVMLARFNQQGDTLWTRSYDHMFNGSKIINAPGGGFMVINNSDHAIALFDSLGNIQWNKILPGLIYNFIIGDAVVSPDNQLVFSGVYFDGSIYSFCMFKVNLAGGLEWFNTYYKPNPGGNTYLRNSTDSGYAMAICGDWDILTMIKTDSLGVSSCSYSMPVTNLQDQTITSAPNFLNLHVVNDMIHPKVSSPPVFLDSLYQLSDYCLNAKVNEISQGNSFAISPNPSTGKFRIEYLAEAQEKLSVTITDIGGRSVFTSQVIITSGAGNIEFDLSDYSPGIYFVGLTGSTANMTMKLIKK